MRAQRLQAFVYGTLDACQTGTIRVFACSRKRKAILLLRTLTLDLVTLLSIERGYEVLGFCLDAFGGP